MRSRVRSFSLLFALGLASTASAEERTGQVANLDGQHLRVSLDASEGSSALRPGGVVAVYVEEIRPDPSGAPMTGLRYAGDARLVWVGEGLVELALATPVAQPRVVALVGQGGAGKSSLLRLVASRRTAGRYTHRAAAPGP